MNLIRIKANIINGIPFPTFVNQTKYDGLVDFPLRSDDVFLTTYPKSGTTWLQQIAKLVKQNGEKAALDYEGKHNYEICPFFEQIGREAVMVSVISSLPQPYMVCKMLIIIIIIIIIMVNISNEKILENEKR